MGGSADLLLPVKSYTGLASWQTHMDRDTPSTEPGTDFYVPHGTPVYAPADGVIWGAGWDLSQPMGRWVGVDFATLGFRCMHHSDLLRTGGKVERGEPIALSGSSGYGSEFFGASSMATFPWGDTGGPHTHATLWPSHDHRFGYRDAKKKNPYTIDIMNFIGGPQLADLGAADLAVTIPQIGNSGMFLAYGVGNPSTFYICNYRDGLTFVARPTLGVEREMLLAVEPKIPRVQMTDDKLIDLLSQGGYKWNDATMQGTDIDGRVYPLV